MEKEAILYMIFDMLGDTVRTGPVLWRIDRKRCEDVKNHVFDLIIMAKILRPYFPNYIDYEKLENYIIVHDLEEAITGDITIFEGISKEEKRRVNQIALDYITNCFQGIFDFESLFFGYENDSDIEAHIAHMLDRVQGSIPFMKYDAEALIDSNNPDVIETLRCHPAVIEGRNDGLTVGEMFYRYHLQSVSISDEQIEKFGITKSDADKITNAIKAFMASVREQCKRVDDIKGEFPTDATTYNKNI